MNNKLIMLLVMFGITVVKAQDVVQLNISYVQNYMRDKGKPDAVINTINVLSIAEKSSRYVNKKIFDANNKAQQKKDKKNKLSAGAAGSSNLLVVTGSPGIFINRNGVIIDEEIITNKRANNITIIGDIGLKVYTHTTGIPLIKWELKNDKKTIIGYECQKAISTFGGRTYEAWFTTALPYTFGPWKLGGLPGLILEARDGGNEISFLAIEVSKNTEKEEIIEAYLLDEEYNIKVKEKEYRGLVKAFLLDPESILKAQYPNKKIGIKNTDDPNNKTINKVKKYNPMELR